MAGRIERALRSRLVRRDVVTTDLAPPPVPAGWKTGPPDFIGVGVQRSGTTWWFDELRAHPVFAAAPGARKELHFFDGFAGRAFGASDVARYRRWFPRPDGRMTGEWTPAYLYLPWATPMLLAAAPEARLLVALRDPVERFRSGLKLQLQRGLSPSDATLDAFHRGLYAGQVAQLFAHAPRAQVHVMLYEEARDEPVRARARLAEFVGLDPSRFPSPVAVQQPRSRGGEPSEALQPPLADLAARYREDVRRLAVLLPDLDFGRWTCCSP